MKLIKGKIKQKIFGILKQNKNQKKNKQFENSISDIHTKLQIV